MKTEKFNSRFFKSLIKCTSSVGLFFGSFAALNGFSQTVDQYNAIPPSLAENTAPLIMLAMSVDHQLFYKAYSDYEDVDGDGLVDTTYDNDIEYAGYFDSSLCYTYSDTDGYFSPSSAISHTLDDDDNISSRGYCNVGTTNNEWSGNFLNWATMTRIDEVRTILFGGLRSTDSSTLTILERSYLPNDAHSFAKFYIGSDLGQVSPFSNIDISDPTNEDHGITICNTTRYTGSSLSQDVTEPPLARVVAGNYTLWNANERAQCLYEDERGGENGNDPALSGIYAHEENPYIADQAQQANGTTVGDYHVRVLACDSTYIDEEHSTQDCKQYPDGNYKPIGLLQEFGEDDSALWGLISGSYTKNKSGGVLRKDIGSITNEVNYLTDGTFNSTPTDGGVIAAINSLRISNYSVADTYRYNVHDSCSWGINSFTDGNCTNWGNPFAEIMQECYRYFSNASPDANFNTDDTSLFPDLITDTTWNNPQTQDTACAELNVIAFNASAVSYDADQLITGVDTATNTVGTEEIVAGSSYFVGDNGDPMATADELCTAKTVGNLADVRGTCPDSPRLGGSYNVAGLSYYAYTNDLRGDLEGEQTVTTWGVDLAPGIPKVEIEVPGSDPVQTVSILPACRNSDVGGNCGLVDFKIVEQGSDATSAWGSFFVNWEDSEQGGDYDQDMSGVLVYRLDASVDPAELTIQTDTIRDSTPDDMGFGYVLGGTTDDGFHVHSGANGYSELGCAGGCNVSDSATDETYDVGTSTATLLRPPLFYAAKWGGFEDTDDNNKPTIDTGTDDGREWDDDGDGSPDNYILAINPVDLRDRMRSMVINILERTAAGTAAAVNAQTGSGEGAIYQALYTPRLKETGSELISWLGTVRSFFIDEYSRLRQDTNDNARLDSTDYVIVTEFDEIERETFIYTYEANSDGTIGNLVGGPFELSDNDNVDPIWDAQDELSKLTNIVANRTNYSDSADGGRYIFTSIDRVDESGGAPDGLVLNPEVSTINPGQSATHDGVYPFVSSTFNLTGDTENDFRYLGLGDGADQDDVNDIVNYIRGDETISGARNRTSGGKAYLLGDIVHSTPAVVGRPSDRYDIQYRDESYEAFANKYRNRRSVVYVGSNDGMLHAFNSGFYNPVTSTFELTSTTETPHPLGSEIWAYVPYNLLPHLQWLVDDDYPHVYYMDGPIRTYDVNIFTPSAKYPNGWGTILVAGMRFGGGDYSFDHDDDPDTDNITTRSAIVVMDITDPEEPPELIAEITDEDLGYTVSEPAVVKYRKRNSSGLYQWNSQNSWYLAFGSGPAGANDTERESALDNGVSFKSSKAFVFDLKNKTLEKFEVMNEILQPEEDSFTSGFASVDWDSDYDDDAVYYGLVAGDAATPEGKLKRAKLEFNESGSLESVAADYSTDLFNDISRAFSATPQTARTSSGEWWVYAGTGRHYVPDDNESSQQQYYFGIKEPRDSNGDHPLQNQVDAYYLLDTTEIDVYEDGRVRHNLTGSLTLNAAGESESLGTNGTFAQVRQFVQEHASGWYFQFETAPTTLNPRVRNTTRAALSGSSLIFTAYEATGEVCDVLGSAYLFAPNIETGIPAPFAPIRTDSNYVLSALNPGDPDVERVDIGKLIGTGAASDPVITGRSVIVQTTTGQLPTTDLNKAAEVSNRAGWGEIPIVW